jgi:hypothetical protein
MYQIINYDKILKSQPCIMTILANQKHRSSFNSSYSLKNGGKYNTEVAYGQATSNLEGYKFNNSGVSLLGALNQSFTLAKDWSATWNSFIVKMEITETQPSNHLTISFT